MASYYLRNLKNDINEIYKLIEIDTSSSTPVKQLSAKNLSNMYPEHGTKPFCNKHKEGTRLVTECNRCCKSFCGFCNSRCDVCKFYSINICPRCCPSGKIHLHINS